VPPEILQKRLLESGYGRVISSTPLTGGDVNQVSRLELESGISVVLKLNPGVPEDLFECEAEGLAALRVPGGPRIPDVLEVDADFILIEDLAPARMAPDYWERFGRQMAVMHGKTAERFGFADNNYLGSQVQLNPWTENGHDFFVEHRLLHQTARAHRLGFFTTAEAEQMHALAARLSELVPVQPASIIHGDLWTGNFLSDSQGHPAIIDPAVYYGWPEADLAMMVLFGNVPISFFEAYDSVRRLDPGYLQRFDLYNLFHLINHMNHFGLSYYGRVSAVLRHYS
jgi:fructosamine-3-kinase